MKVGDMVTYGNNLGWRKRGVGIVVEALAFIKVVFPSWHDGYPDWYHPDTLELVNAIR